LLNVKRESILPSSVWGMIVEGYYYVWFIDSHSYEPSSQGSCKSWKQ